MTAFSKTLTLTRTADTTAYTAGDVIGASTSSAGAVLTFDEMGPASGPARVLITSARLLVEKSSVPAGMTSFRLHLYSESPASALADNAAWDLTSGDWTAYRGYVDLGTPVDVGSALYCEVNILNKQVGVTTGTLYGYLVTNGGYTPGSADVMLINIGAILV